ncbi:hypothetical protein C8J57DRAFT_1714782 [Mycena rebaudengoi]|nr:hypothetical protein C8J57DRAFT_1714782 [Mycena rebaudengoi]
MNLITITSIVLLSALSVSADTWGGALSLGPAKTNIIKATTTIVPGAAPVPQNGNLFLWPGMSNGTGDLIQSTLESWPDENAWCGAKLGEWCVRASVFGSFGQIDGVAGVVKPTDAVLIDYTLQSNRNTWSQTVSIAGKVVTSLNHDSGPFMKGWGTGTECNNGCSGTIAVQTYTNTVITLDAADPTFGSTLRLSAGATFTGLTNEQSGKVWKIASISVPKMV